MQILYQDKHILVVNKPSGLLSQPGRVVKDSVVQRLEKKFAFIGLVHRLDQFTSGIMVVGLNKEAQSNLSKQFIDRQTFKVYEAVVYGSLPCPQGQINLPIRCDWPNRPRQEVHPEGKQSLTHWQRIDSYVIKPDASRENNHANNIHYTTVGNQELDMFADRDKYSYGADHQNSNNTVSRILLIPYTGRSHQLRIHMAAIGHPIIGDYFYAHDQAFNMANRLNLHAKSLYLNHPYTGQRMHFESNTPF
jgi:tRNA pseudouridine32 synthase/23S rRNA pseudouridine746 synthase